MTYRIIALSVIFAATAVASEWQDGNSMVKTKTTGKDPIGVNLVVTNTSGATAEFRVKGFRNKEVGTSGSTTLKPGQTWTVPNYIIQKGDEIGYTCEYRSKEDKKEAYKPDKQDKEDPFAGLKEEPTPEKNLKAAGTGFDGSWSGNTTWTYHSYGKKDGVGSSLDKTQAIVTSLVIKGNTVQDASLGGAGTATVVKKDNEMMVIRVDLKEISGTKSKCQYILTKTSDPNVIDFYSTTSSKLEQGAYSYGVDGTVKGKLRRQ